MLIYICSKAASWFVRNDLLEKELFDWYVYWLQKRILTTLIVLIMFFVGSFVFRAEITACFLLGLLPLRRHLVGYHAESPLACMALSVGVVSLALLLNSTFSETASLIFGVLNFIISFILVMYVLKEIPDPKLGLTEAEIHENHKLAIRHLLLESAAGAIIAILLRSTACWSACQMGIAVVIISSLYLKWKEVNKHGKHYEKRKEIDKHSAQGIRFESKKMNGQQQVPQYFFSRFARRRTKSRDKNLQSKNNG